MIGNSWSKSFNKTTILYSIGTSQNAQMTVECGISQQTVIYSNRKSFVTNKYESIINYQRNPTKEPATKDEASESDPLLGRRVHDSSDSCYTYLGYLNTQRSRVPACLADEPSANCCFTLILYTIPWIAMMILFVAVYLNLPSWMSPPESKHIL